MIKIVLYIHEFKQMFPGMDEELPWDITSAAQLIVSKRIKTLGADYNIKDNIAIHKDAVIEEHVIIKGPAIISANCFIGSHAYLRNGVFLGDKVSVGPGCEIKSSLIFSNSSLAHFNFVGDSIVGSYVNMEAGSVVANHFNERKDKVIKILSDNEIISTGIEKFGALIGDQTKIGANAVLSPGTILQPKSIVKRLELVEQVKD
jgi:UDP-N-acetylglucosamine diphosphorylase / glucose-1-phosphate thymidylyltransferase / UDP-N-acetylgalactosamine diphosphorylase / glucosamine-1-phosphate N-acetyltransferase / galactosamine-1-phosphate N-acetyltransferase